MVKLQIRIAGLMAKKIEEEGIKCRSCGCRDFINSRTIRRIRGYVWKIKACRNCGKEIRIVEREDKSKGDNG